MADGQTVGKILFTAEQITMRARALGEEITRDYAGQELILVGTLKGSIMWMAEMMKFIDLDTQIDFIAASSYGKGTTSSGIVKLEKDISLDISDKHVMIMEDIIDTGNTLLKLREYFRDKNAKSVKICTMLDKPSRRSVDVQGDYIGFTVEDLFIVGYGLDFDQKYRNLPYISYLQD